MNEASEKPDPFHRCPDPQANAGGYALLGRETRQKPVDEG